MSSVLVYVAIGGRWPRPRTSGHGTNLEDALRRGAPFASASPRCERRCVRRLGGAVDGLAASLDEEDRAYATASKAALRRSGRDQVISPPAARSMRRR